MAKTKDAPAKAAAKKPKSAWLLHIEATRKANPELKFKDVLKKASESWTKK